MESVNAVEIPMEKIVGKVDRVESYRKTQIIHVEISLVTQPMQAATSTKSNRAKIDGLLHSNFM